MRDDGNLAPLLLVGFHRAWADVIADNTLPRMRGRGSNPYVSLHLHRPLRIPETDLTCPIDLEHSWQEAHQRAEEARAQRIQGVLAPIRHRVGHYLAAASKS